MRIDKKKNLNRRTEEVGGRGKETYDQRIFPKLGPWSFGVSGLIRGLPGCSPIRVGVRSKFSLQIQQGSKFSLFKKFQHGEPLPESLSFSRCF